MQPTYYKIGTNVGRYWKEIVSLISDAVIIYDEHGEIHFANQSALLSLRYKSSSGLPIDSLDDLMERFMVADENGAVVTREEMPCRRAFRSESAKQAQLRFTDQSGRHDYWLAVKAVPIFDSRRLVRFIVVIFQDITVFKTTEANLKDANRRMMGMLEGFLETKH